MTDDSSGGEPLSPQQEASLIAFLARNVDLHNEVVYDSSDSYCHLAVRYDPDVGFRLVVSGPRDYVIYSQQAITGHQALEHVRHLMVEASWPFPPDEEKPYRTTRPGTSR